MQVLLSLWCAFPQFRWVPHLHILLMAFLYSVFVCHSSVPLLLGLRSSAKEARRELRRCGKTVQAQPPSRIDCSVPPL